ncbi:guanine nucleotide-binding protein subunit beta-like protein 1 [Chironomus tepperi]|uniref:guanine nucleotide-binding protein subunit beta-like protein 1 n=1 Tax=Chironomus tepperi TaxID=113505 RepID=UPI00391EFA8C
MLQPDPSFHLKVQDPVHSLDFLSQQLLTGCASGKIKVFCLSSLRSNYELKASSSPIVFISSNTESLICQDRAGIVKVYDLQKNGYVINTEIQTNHTGFARSIRLNGEKDILLTPNDSSDINVFDVQNISTVPIHKLSFTSEETGQIMCMRELNFSTDSSYLLAGYESGHLVLWDLKEFREIHFIKYDFPICNVDYDSSTNRGVVSSPTIHKIHVFGINRMNLELQQRDAESIELQHNEGKKVAGVSSLKIRSDKKCLFVGSCDGVVDIVSWKSLRKLATLRNHRSEISDIAFSNTQIDNFKSNLSAIGSIDGSVSLWDIYYKKS